MRPRRITSCCGVAAAFFALTSLPAGADTFEWTDPVNGIYGNPGNWTRTAGFGAAPPGVGDMAEFNEPGAYTVTFNANEFSDQFSLSAGDVTFEPGAGPWNYVVTTGGADAFLSSGSLTLGTVGTPLDMHIGDQLLIGDGAAVNILFGSDLNAGNLQLATAFGGTTGAILVDGVGSTLTIINAGNHDVGAAGAAGSLTFQNGSAGNDIDGTLNLAATADPNSVGNLTVQGVSSLDLGNVNAGTGGAVGQSSTILVDGSMVTQSNGALPTLTLGAASNSTAELKIDNGGIYTTGTGQTTVNATGTITVGSVGNGTLNVAGNLTLDGGTLTRTNGSTLDLAANKTLIAQNDGQLSITGDYELDDNTVFTFQSGADLATTGVLNVGNGTDGTLTVDGSGSSLSTGGTSTWGSGGTSGTVTIRNSATGTLGVIDLAHSAVAGTTGAFDIENAAVVTTDDINVATQGGATTSGTLTVTDVSSSLTQNGASTLSVGHAANGNGIVTVDNGGILTTGTGAITINATGVIQVGTTGGGTLNANGDMTLAGGSLSVDNGGTFNFATGKVLTAQSDGQVSFDGNYDIDDGTTFNIESGADLSFGSNVVVGRSSTSGTLTVDGLGSSVTGGVFTSGSLGGTGTTTFSNQATANVGSMVVNSSAPAGSGSLTVESDADLSIGMLRVADSGGTGTVNLTGDGSTIIQGSSSLAIRLGHASLGVANLNISDGGSFTTNDKLTTINATGTLTISDATSAFVVNGDITVDGGELNVGSGSTFSLAADKTMTVSNGGTASFLSRYDTATNAIYNITGTNSLLEVMNASFNVRNDTQINVNSGGSISATSVSVGQVGNGTLSVDGIGSSVVCGTGLNRWGSAGTMATITFTNGATGVFNGTTQLAFSGGADVTTVVSVQSGADLTFGDLLVDDVGGVNSSVTVTITGIGSSVALKPSRALTIGYTSGAGQINVLDGGSLTVGSGGTTTLNATGIININDGTVSLGSVTYNGGTLNFNSGALLIANDQTIGVGTLLGDNLTLLSDRSLSIGGATTIDPFKILTVDGGTFNTGSLVIDGTFDFVGGTVGITGAGGLTVGTAGSFGSSLSIGANQVLDVTNTLTVDAGAALSLTTGGSISAGAISNSGRLHGNGTLTGPLTNNAGGEVQGLAGTYLLLTGNGNTNNGQVTLTGGQVHFTQDLTNSATGLVIGNGTLRADGGTTNSGDMAFSATANVIGDLTNNASGLITSSGGTTTFFDDVVNNGEVRTNQNSFTVYYGSYSGNGDTGIGTVIMEGDLKPGSSPGLMAFAGNLSFGPVANLEIEIAGSAPGSEFDVLNVLGDVTLGGTLDVTLLNPFSLSAGQSFEIIDVGGSQNGTFLGLAEGGLVGSFGGTNVFITYSGGDGNDVALLAALPGDFDIDGDVDGFDFLMWQRGESPTPFSALDLAAWEANYGAVSSIAASSTAVPEPSTWLGLLIGMLALLFRRDSVVS